MQPAYSSAVEDGVSRYFERFAARDCSQLRFVLRHPLQTLALLRAVRALPMLTARLGDDAQGGAIRGQLGRTRLRRHVLAGATAVLRIPNDPDDYLRGSSRSKSTLRTRSRAAAAGGVRIEQVVSRERRLDLCALADLHERADLRQRFRNPEADNADMLDHRYWFVALHEGRPVMLAVLPAHARWAALRYFRMLEPSREATLSRYLMMSGIVTALAHDGVRHVVVGLGPHRLGNGVRQFQRMTGFRTVRLSVARSGVAGVGPTRARAVLQQPGGSPIRAARTLGG